ncbi:hypothetical protein [Sporomusa acidovorans]|uniref:Uncharacterized protein n=1 Tax=Sporomusa acidovorans (strain ATCC 49682 / DSM 3132 / Mol) TaxID=1123286 RepID=A0ABZ3IZI8_SPOA4|nr:hypothetical protein [Sporomusa acidovorans]OZC22898.1 hypothetical protein SPACI_10640 [Sporomusa acidovorans DSM 3132]SDF74225.1 hypothetical protein SAMN04488499_107515 [Sporomusa acidovorans]
MSTNPVPNTNPNLNAANTPVSWRKRYRAPLMNAAFWGFWIGFFLAHQGGVSNNTGLINLSYVIFTLACLVPLVTKK